jgi:UDPglucose 6-dehydrogenase
VLGLSFKKNTDDMREAPATKVIPILSQAGAVVSAYDPMAIATSKAWFPDWKVAYAQTPLETLKDADAVFVLVEWPELTSLPVKDIVAAVKPKALFVDARNQYAGKRKELEESGLRYVGVGVA